ncbi:hypothetical protein LFM09_47825 [Lentzea alba]|uniref:hypothetical protein n=1 Tax=Lentzea alba TaxID=2714351 RepID=UPI0039BED695
MGVFPANLVTAEALAALLSAPSKSRAVGQLSWTSKKPHIHEGKIEVRTDIADCPVGYLRIYYVDPRPAEVGVQFIVNDAPVRRLDLNGSHKDWVHTTHKHRYLPATGREDAYIPNDIPAVPLLPTVAPGTHRAVFEAFAQECLVLLPEGYWVEP